MDTKSNNKEQDAITYVCGKCHGEIRKDDEVCPHCGVKLGKIKCPYCGFTGDANDFKRDRCPKCGRVKTLSVNLNTPHYYRSSSKKTPSPINRSQPHSYKTGCIIMSLVFVVSVIVFLIHFKII